MNIKKLFIITVLVVGLTPNNSRTEYMQCPCAQTMDEDDGSEWRIISPEERQEEQEAAEPLISFVEKHHPEDQCAVLPPYASRPANVSFHTQTQPCNATPEDPYAPCDIQFQEREMEEEQEREAEQPYVVIYRVK